MTTFGFFAATGAALAIATVSTPASAAPNAFWMFGWSAHYNHGTGGLAEATDPAPTAILAYAPPTTLLDEAPVAVAAAASTAPPTAAAPLQLASDDSVAMR